ncbi:MAG: electron transfer flavoprotein subunit alpha/FixB family protein [Chloroflexi bacterium]|nr:electron transfer flavoprotein subunit alpha/FixB family protein [Chloroflexota bacterium]MCI0782989.1 electron transfer flavoprotein subunit alpha/FixB family protein [Chloroflexota bacterium]MCI0884943.1 electron transfer flavoprotein subunit alpha/FixB family protein [Chloroflexota bacterium]
MPNGVLIFGEATEDGKLVAITAELSGAAAALGGPVTCALLGSGVEGVAEEAGQYGAEKVILVDDPILKDYQGDAYLPVAERIAKEIDPAVILFGQTMIGRDLAPRLAQRLGTAVAMDCVALSMEGDKLLAERPAYGGAARARYTFNGTPQIATVRVKALDAPAASGSAEVVKQDAGVSADQVRTTITGRTKPESTGIRLEDATVVVSGGRGLGGPEAFQQLEELAGVLGGAVGASRAVCDLGWYPVAAQVGLTGKMVTPDLYIAIGISGASQHMAGISSVKNIASVNKDADASIFKASRWAVVHDWKEFMPLFLEEVKKVKAG